MEVHQHGLKLGEVSYLVIFYSKHHNFLAFSIGWLSIYYFFLLRDRENDLNRSKNKTATVEYFFVKMIEHGF